MKNLFVSFVLASGIMFFPASIEAKTPEPIASATPSATIEPSEAPRVDITQKTEEVVGPLEKLIKEQNFGNVWPFNPVKYAIKVPNAIRESILK